MISDCQARAAALHDRSQAEPSPQLSDLAFAPVAGKVRGARDRRDIDTFRPLPRLRRRPPECFRTRQLTGGCDADDAHYRRPGVPWECRRPKGAPHNDPYRGGRPWVMMECVGHRISGKTFERPGTIGPELVQDIRAI